MMDENGAISDVELLEFLVNFTTESRSKVGPNLPSEVTPSCGSLASSPHGLALPSHCDMEELGPTMSPWPTPSPSLMRSYHAHQYHSSPHLSSHAYRPISPLQCPADSSYCSSEPGSGTRDMSCTSETEYSDTMVECWEPGEILDGEESAHEEEVTSTHEGRPRPGRNCQQRQKNLYLNETRPRGPGKKRGPRPKKLSANERRQKRMDANDRERDRMNKLNVAFDNLRHLLPKHGNDRELSKFETIQIAKNYIRSLHQLLEQTSNGSSRFDASLNDDSLCSSPLECSFEMH